MTWNWQKDDWPHFSWDKKRLAKSEEQFLLKTGMFAGVVKHLEPEDREQLTVEAMSTEALTTSEIEGEILDRASVQSSIRKELGLAADKRRPKPSEQGIAQMMVDSYRRFSEPLSDEMLFRWHHMLVRGRDDLRDIGRYRTGDEPMQVVSGATHGPRVHFEAPPSATMRREMKNFVTWFNHTAPGVSRCRPSQGPASRISILYPFIRSRMAMAASAGRLPKRRCQKASASPRLSLWPRPSSTNAKPTTTRWKRRTRITKSQRGFPGSLQLQLKPSGERSRTWSSSSTRPGSSTVCAASSTIARKRRYCGCCAKARMGSRVV